MPLVLDGTGNANANGHRHGAKRHPQSCPLFHWTPGRSPGGRAPIAQQHRKHAQADWNVGDQHANQAQTGHPVCKPCQRQQPAQVQRDAAQRHRAVRAAAVTVARGELSLAVWAILWAAFLADATLTWLVTLG